MKCDTTKQHNKYIFCLNFGTSWIGWLNFYVNSKIMKSSFYSNNIFISKSPGFSAAGTSSSSKFINSSTLKPFSTTSLSPPSTKSTNGEQCPDSSGPTYPNGTSMIWPYQIPALKVSICNKSFIGVFDTCSQFTLAGKPLVEYLLSNDVITKPVPFSHAKILSPHNAIIKRVQADIDIKWSQGEILQIVIYMPDIKYDIILGRDFMKNTSIVLRMSQRGWSFDKYPTQVYPFYKVPYMNDDSTSPMNSYNSEFQFPEKYLSSSSSIFNYENDNNNDNNVMTKEVYSHGTLEDDIFDTTFDMTGYASDIPDNHAGSSTRTRIESLTTEELNSPLSSGEYLSDASTTKLSPGNQNEVVKIEHYQDEEIKELERKEFLTQEFYQGYKSKNLTSINSSVPFAKTTTGATPQNKEQQKQKAQAILDEINHIYDLLEIANDDGSDDYKVSELNQLVQKLLAMYRKIMREMDSF